MKRPAFWFLMLFLSIGLTGCDFVGDVLEFGFWMILILLALVVGLGYWVYSRVRGRRR